MVAPGWGACVVAAGGGMRGCSRGACVVAPGGGMCGFSGGCMVAPGGVCMVAAGRACMVAPGGVWLLRGGEGHAWDTTRYGDTINERAVRILLECILVHHYFSR